MDDRSAEACSVPGRVWAQIKQQPGILTGAGVMLPLVEGFNSRDLGMKVLQLRGHDDRVTDLDSACFDDANENGSAPGDCEDILHKKPERTAGRYEVLR